MRIQHDPVLSLTDQMDQVRADETSEQELKGSPLGGIEQVAAATAMDAEMCEEATARPLTASEPKTISASELLDAAIDEESKNSAKRNKEAYNTPRETQAVDVHSSTPPQHKDQDVVMRDDNATNDSVKMEDVPHLQTFTEAENARPPHVSSNAKLEPLEDTALTAHVALPAGPVLGIFETPKPTPVAVTHANNVPHSIPNPASMEPVQVHPVPVNAAQNPALAKIEKSEKGLSRPSSRAQSIAPSSVEQGLPQGAPVRVYLNEHVTPTLLEGMKMIAKEK